MKIYFKKLQSILNSLDAYFFVIVSFTLPDEFSKFWIGPFISQVTIYSIYVYRVKRFFRLLYNMQFFSSLLQDIRNKEVFASFSSFLCVIAQQFVSSLTHLIFSGKTYYKFQFFIKPKKYLQKISFVRFILLFKVQKGICIRIDFVFQFTAFIHFYAYFFFISFSFL